jgi:hypothetical protein
MPDLSRFFVRLRRRILQAYDALLYAMLLALAAGALIPSSAQDPPPEEPAQCGNIQSSAVVMTK